MTSRTTRNTLTLAAVLLAAPSLLAAQEDSKRTARDRAASAVQMTNGLRARGASDMVRPITVGSRQNSALDAEDPTLPDGSHAEVWAVELRAGQTVVVTMRSDAFDTMLLMGNTEDPENSAENDDFEDGSTDSRITFRARSNGTYAIIANSYEGGQRGPYTIEVQAAGNQGGGGGAGLGDLMSGGAAGGNALNYGASVNGTLSDSDRTLDDGSKYDEYTFTGNAGDVVVISMSSSEFDTYLLLRDASGETVADNDDQSEDDTNSQVVVTLPRSGTFRILANSYGAGEFGAYTLTLRKR